MSNIDRLYARLTDAGVDLDRLLRDEPDVKAYHVPRGRPGGSYAVRKQRRGDRVRA